MPNMKEKNYRVYAEIENLDEFLEAVKIKPGQINTLKEDKLTNNKDSNKAKGFFINDAQKRYFCSCGYISNTLDSNGKPVCPNCNNLDWVIFESSRHNDITTQINLNYNKNENMWNIVYTDWKLTKENDRSLVILKKEEVLNINLNEENFEKYEDQLEKTRNYILEEDAVLKLLEVLPFNKDLMFFKRIMFYRYSGTTYLDRTLVLINYILTEGLDTFKDKFLKDNFSPDIFTLLYEPTKEVNVSVESVAGLLINDLRNKSLDDIAKQIGFDKYDNFYLKSLLRKELRTLNYTLKHYATGKKLKKKEENLYKTLISDGVFKTYFSNMENKFHLILDDFDLFEVFYLKNKHIYGSESITVFLDRVEFCKKNNIDKDLINSNYFNGLLNSSNLTKMKIPEDKVKLFNHYIDIDPLKAYSFLANRRKLTKKEIEEYKTIIKD